MAKRVGFWLVCCLVILACLQAVGCTSTPTLFHAVVLTPNTAQTIGTGTSLPITATVSNDTSGAGVTWSTPASGTLSGVTTTSATYNAPSVAPGTSVTDTVTATSVTFPAQSASLSITVQGVPLITTTSLPGGNWGSPYNATVSGAGGVPPFTWSISAGSLTTGLSLGASTTRTVTISGTPGAQANSNFTIKMQDSTGAFATQALTIAIGAPLPLQVTTTTLPNGALNVAYPSTTLQASGGVPPFTWTVTSGNLPTGLSLAANGTITGTPTAAGTFNFTVQVTDSQSVTATANLSITVNNLGPLNGDYAFEFSGFDSSGGVVIAGSFTADGKGNISNGVEDFNTIAGPPKNQSFTGTYTLGSDGRGQLIFSSLSGSPTYAFAIDSTGSHGRLIEFDASRIRGSGQLEKRSASTCTSNTINGNWAFGIAGQQIAISGISGAGPAVVAGSFQATPPASPGGQGSIGPGEDDSSTPQGVLPQSSLSGTFQTTSQSTRCTMTLSPSVGNMTFSVYPVSSSEAFLVETDIVNSTTPFLIAGKMREQVGAPFLGTDGSTFTATSVAGLSGAVIPSGGTAYLPYVAIVELTPTGLGGFTMPMVENLGGTVQNAIGSNAVSGTFGTGDRFGRVNTNLLVPIEPVFYVVGPNEAFCILENVNTPVLGIFEPQSAGPFTASAINGSLALGTVAPAMVPPPDFTGAVTLANTTTTAGTVNGAQDTSTSSANTAGQTVTGTFNITDQTAGVGTLTLTAPTAFTGQFFIVSPTKLVMISTTSGDANPVLIFLGN
jgi:Putative Ig domain